MKKWTPKNKYLFFISLFLLGLSYFFSFRKTFAVKKHYLLLKQQEVVLNNTPKKLKALKQKVKDYDQFLEAYNLSNKDNSIASFLETAYRIAALNKILIQEFKEPHVYINKETQSKVTTYIFHFKGDYKGIIETIYTLEQKHTFGNITHFGFYKKKNYSTGKFNLFAEVHIQRLKTLKN